MIRLHPLNKCLGNHTQVPKFSSANKSDSLTGLRNKPLVSYA